MGNRACLAVNDVGKPCAGDPHARFERGPLEKRGTDETSEKPQGQRSVSTATDHPAAYHTASRRPRWDEQAQRAADTHTEPYVRGNGE